MWEILNDGFPDWLLNAAQSLYENIRIIIDKGRNMLKLTTESKRGARKGCTLSLSVLNLCLDESTEGRKRIFGNSFMISSKK